MRNFEFRILNLEQLSVSCCFVSEIRNSKLEITSGGSL